MQLIAFSEHFQDPQETTSSTIRLQRRTSFFCPRCAVASNPGAVLLDLEDLNERGDVTIGLSGDVMKQC